MSNIKNLYYITHINNLPSILTKGILSHQRIRSEGVENTTIYLKHLVNKRGQKYTSDGKNLWHYANLFFQPRNSTLYYVIRKEGKENITVLRLSNTVLQRRGIFITDGIASNKLTRIYSQSEGLEVLRVQQEFLQSRSWISWNHSETLKRRLMAECLVPDQVYPNDTQQFIVADQSVANSLRVRLLSSNIQKLVVASDIGSNIFTPFKKV